jgi:hypothetical protein
MVTSSHIARVVLGPVRHVDMPSCHKSCLGPIKNFSCHVVMARQASHAWKSKHEAREGRVVPSPSFTSSRICFASQLIIT